MKILLIEITVDTNDADYQTTVSPITDEQLETIRPLLEAMKAKKKSKYGGYEYRTRDCVRDDLRLYSAEKLYNKVPESVHELFQEFCPVTERGFHTVENVFVYPPFEKTKLL